MSQTIKINIEGLNNDKIILDKASKDVRFDKLRNAIQLIKEGMDSTGMGSCKSMLNEVDKKTKKLENKLLEAVEMITVCIDTYTSIDDYLAKQTKTDSSNEPVKNTTTTSNTANDTSENIKPDVVTTPSSYPGNDKVGQVIANTNSSYYDSYRVAHSSYNGGDLECVGYAKGRFEEITGHRLNIRGNAIDYQYNYVNDEAVTYTTNINEIKLPAVAVTRGAMTQYGHVVVIENLDYDGNGNITKIYFTEGNSVGANGILKVKSYSDFYRDGQWLKPYGFISLK